MQIASNTLKRELHDTTDESEQMLAQDLPVLNESLKAKGQLPIESTSYGREREGVWS